MLSIFEAEAELDLQSISEAEAELDLLSISDAEAEIHLQSISDAEAELDLLSMSEAEAEIYLLSISDAEAELDPVEAEFLTVKVVCGFFEFLSFRRFIRSRVSREVCFLRLRLFSAEVVIVWRSSSLQFLEDKVTTVAGGAVFTLFSDLL